MRTRSTGLQAVRVVCEALWSASTRRGSTIATGMPVRIATRPARAAARLPDAAVGQAGQGVGRRSCVELGLAARRSRLTLMAHAGTQPSGGDASRSPRRAEPDAEEPRPRRRTRQRHDAPPPGDRPRGRDARPGGRRRGSPATSSPIGPPGLAARRAKLARHANPGPEASPRPRRRRHRPPRRRRRGARCWSSTGRSTRTGACRRASSTPASRSSRPRCARSRRRPACAAGSGDHVGSNEYRDRHGRSSGVDWWLMEPLDGELRAQRRGRRDPLGHGSARRRATCSPHGDDSRPDRRTPPGYQRKASAEAGTSSARRSADARALVVQPDRSSTSSASAR